MPFLDVTGKHPFLLVYIFPGVPVVSMPTNAKLMTSPVFLVFVSSFYSPSAGFVDRIFFSIFLCILLLWPHYLGDICLPVGQWVLATIEISLFGLLWYMLTWMGWMLPHVFIWLFFCIWHMVCDVDPMLWVIYNFWIVAYFSRQSSHIQTST